MRIPQILQGPGPKLGRKKTLDAVSIYANGDIIQELAVRESGNSIQCFVPVCLDDRLTVQFNIPYGEFEVVDLIIDGILRETSFNKKLSNPHKGNFKRVCHRERIDSESMGRTQHYEMIVTPRTNTHDTAVGLSNFSDTGPLSAVGTIEVRVYRQISANIQQSQSGLPAQAERTETFEDYAAWWELNKSIDINGGNPPYEIGFGDPKSVYGASKKNFNREVLGAYLWASFKYVYRSVSDVKAMGFAMDGDAFGSSSKSKNHGPSQFAGMTHGPITISRDILGVGESSFSEVDSQITSAKKLNGASSLPPFPSNSAPATSVTSNRKSKRSDLGSKKKVPRTAILPLGKKRFFGDDFPVPLDDYESTSEEEEDLPSNFEEGRVKHEYGGVQSDLAKTLQPQIAARYVQLEADASFTAENSEFDVQNDDKPCNSLLDINTSSSLISKKSWHARDFEEDVGLSAKRMRLSRSFSTEAESKIAVVNPMDGITQNRDNEKEAHDLLNSVLSGFKDEDGRNFTALSLAEISGYTSKYAIIKSAEQQGHLKENPAMEKKNRKFSKEMPIEAHPSFEKEWSFISGTERSFSRSARREEHARTKETKKRALDMANAKAEAYRKQLEVLEAKEAAEEEAEYEAELEEIERATKLANQQSEVYRARIQELEDRDRR